MVFLSCGHGRPKLQVFFSDNTSIYAYNYSCIGHHNDANAICLYSIEGTFCTHRDNVTKAVKLMLSLITCRHLFHLIGTSTVLLLKIYRQ